MSIANFDAFRAELAAVRAALAALERKTVRDETLIERVRTLSRVWYSSVKPGLQQYVQGPAKNQFFKLDSELQALAALTSKYRPVAKYRQRLIRALHLANTLVLELPPEPEGQTTGVVTPGEALFIPGVPDLPLSLVPNPLLGWKSRMLTFVEKHGFDRCVFIMIRYRPENERLRGVLKDVLGQNGYQGIVAADHRITDDLYNPVACLLCCAKGIAVFDQPEETQIFNPNVAYELGMMHLLGRDVLILKHTSLAALHTDVLMRLYEEYSTIDHAIAATKARVTAWTDEGS